MDLSFAIQALYIEHMIKSGSSLPKKVIPVPKEIDRRVAALKLHAMGLRIDALTDAQKTYMYGEQS